eukprot:gene35513-50993_t
MPPPVVGGGREGAAGGKAAGARATRQGEGACDEIAVRLTSGAGGRGCVTCNWGTETCDHRDPSAMPARRSARRASNGKMLYTNLCTSTSVCSGVGVPPTPSATDAVGGDVVDDPASSLMACVGVGRAAAERLLASVGGDVERAAEIYYTRQMRGSPGHDEVRRREEPADDSSATAAKSSGADGAAAPTPRPPSVAAAARPTSV